MNDWIFLILGLVVLVFGAECLVRGASSLAARIGISPLVVGLTVVAFGTSSPEIAVSYDAVKNGQSDIVLGNVIGSNIFNILIILGLSALVRPLIVQQNLLKIEVPIVALSGVMIWFLLRDGLLGGFEGLALLLCMIVYTVFVIRSARRESKSVQDEYAEAAPKGKGRVLTSIAGIAIGLVLLMLGSRWLVSSSSSIAASFGVSELFIGLTIIAAGTSLPELATSIIAAYRGQRDIAVGNVLGSNLFNILAIPGLTQLIAWEQLPAGRPVTSINLPIMIGVSLVCVPVMFTGYRISRLEGGAFLVSYAAYIVYLILDAADHPALGTFTACMLWVFLPLAVLVIVFSLITSRRFGATDT